MGAEIAKALRAVFGLPRRAARRLREQVAKEDRERVITQLAVLEQSTSAAALELMWREPRSIKLAAAEDPLEELWKLPALARRDRRRKSP